MTSLGLEIREIHACILFCPRGIETRVFAVLLGLSERFKGMADNSWPELFRERLQIQEPLKFTILVTVWEHTLREPTDFRWKAAVTVLKYTKS